MGGWLVRTFASTYPAEVAGMVLLEAGGDDPWRLTADGTAVRSSRLASERPIPPALTSGPLRESDIPPGLWSQVEAQAREMGRWANASPRDKLPADAQRMRSWSISQVKHHIVNDNPHEAEELAQLRAERERSEHPYGDIPLVVVSRGLADDGTVDASAEAAEYAAERVALARLSRNGSHVVAPRSGHHVQLDEPELVVRIIADVVAAVKR
jgi:pimeloyl-ACP methyl ester carboxylesterase